MFIFEIVNWRGIAKLWIFSKCMFRDAEQYDIMQNAIDEIKLY